MDRFFFRACILIVALTTSGCTSLRQAFHTPQPPDPTITDKTAPQDTSSPLKGLDNITGRLVENNCTLENPAQPNLGGLAHYTSCAKHHIDDLCYNYFSYLDKAADGSRFGRREFNTLADLTTTILGITKTPAEQLAILSGARVAVTDTWNATEEMLLLSPAPFKVYKLVVAKQVKLYSDYQTAHGKDDVAKPVWPENYDAAFGLVREYASYCTRVGIHDMLDEIVQEKVANTSADRNLNSHLAASLDNVASALNIKAGGNIKRVSSVSVDDALALHSYLVAPQTSQMGGYLALRGLKANIDAMSDSEKTALTQFVDKVIASSPDIAQRIQETTPTSPLSTGDLVKDAKFTLKGGGTILIGEPDADHYIHYKALDNTGQPTGADLKDPPDILLTKIDNKAK